MIKIEVDESYAFDYLSILHLKYDLDKTNALKESNYLRCLNFIKKQFSDDLFQSIINSVEYKDCYNANFQTYEAVDLAKTNLVAASYVDKCNYKRHVAKQKLQKKFFNSNLTEIKIGYEQYSKEK